MSHIILSALQQWFFAGFFVLFGLVFLWRAPVDGPSGTLNHVKVCGEAALRLERVWSKRCENEEISATIRLLPTVACFVLAIVTVTHVLPGPICYGILMLIVSASAAAAYLQLRNKLPIRVAVLSPRKPAAVIPIVWFALGVVQGLLALDAVQVRSKGTEVAAVFVCVSTILCVWLAWRVTEMAALLAGDDVAMEEFVDARLRFQRSANILLYAFVQSFVFLSFARTGSWSVTASAALLLVFGIWFMTRILRRSEFREAPA